MARQADQPAGKRQDFRPGRAEILVLQRRQFGQALGQTLRAAGVQPGNALGQPGDLVAGQPEGLGGFSDGHARLKKDVVADHGTVAAEILQHLTEHLVPLVPGKIDIDVGGIGPAGVEKAFEIEIVLDRANISDIETIGDDRCRA